MLCLLLHLFRIMTLPRLLFIVAVLEALPGVLPHLLDEPQPPDHAELPIHAAPHRLTLTPLDKLHNWELKGKITIKIRSEQEDDGHCIKSLYGSVWHIEITFFLLNRRLWDCSLLPGRSRAVSSPHAASVALPWPVVVLSGLLPWILGLSLSW